MRAIGPDLPPYALTGVVVEGLDFLWREVHVTALAARESGEMFAPFLMEEAAERRASVTSESSKLPVPVEITTAHFPMAARRTWWDRLGFHSRDTIGFFVSTCSDSSFWV